jgi:hypothetical protein
MKTLTQIQQEFAEGRFEFSRHAFKRAVERNVGEVEIRHVGQAARIIEDYPEDKYSPSCLLLGYTSSGRPLHLQISRADLENVKIVTLYEPDPAQWIDDEKRREP